MISLRVLPIKTESFALLVKRLKRQLNDADIFEIDLDFMRVKGDLAVIQRYFGKPMIAKSHTLDLLRRGVKAGMTYAEMPWDLETDLEFETLANNKGTKLIRVLSGGEDMLAKRAHYYRLADQWFDANGGEIGPLFEYLQS